MTLLVENPKTSTGNSLSCAVTPILLDDSLALAQKAKADGVDVTLRIWDDMWHAWPVLGELIPESRIAFEEISEFLRRLDAY